MQHAQAERVEIVEQGRDQVDAVVYQVEQGIEVGADDRGAAAEHPGPRRGAEVSGEHRGEVAERLRALRDDAARVAHRGLNQVEALVKNTEDPGLVGLVQAVQERPQAQRGGLLVVIEARVGSGQVIDRSDSRPDRMGCGNAERGDADGVGGDLGPERDHAQVNRGEPAAQSEPPESESAAGRPRRRAGRDRGRRGVAQPARIGPRERGVLREQVTDLAQQAGLHHQVRAGVRHVPLQDARVHVGLPEQLGLLHQVGADVRERAPGQAEPERDLDPPAGGQPGRRERGLELGLEAAQVGLHRDVDDRVQAGEARG